MSHKGPESIPYLTSQTILHASSRSLKVMQISWWCQIKNKTRSFWLSLQTNGIWYFCNFWCKWKMNITQKQKKKVWDSNRCKGAFFGGLHYILTYRYTSWQKLLLLVRNNLLQWSPNELCFLLNILFISSCVTSQMSELVEHVGLGTTREETTRIILFHR